MVTIDNPFNAPGTWIFRLGNANIDSMKIYSKDLLATAEVPGVSKSGYEITAAYDNIHNITNKSFKKQLYIGGTTYKKTSYDREYLYDPARPHAVVNMRNNALPFWHIFRHYEYDANGNVTQHNNYNRQILWDEENRIKQVTDTFPRTAPVSENYFYDHKGERKIKVNNYNTGAPQLGDVAMYVNQYAAMWLSNANNVNTYTKNYYVGNQRVASRIMSDAACATGGFDFTYFYGTDHLGSSTYLTDASGDIVEHNEYTPWGEIWQTEDNMPVVSVGKLNNPFKFTGKEMDRTGLYYYGARYYDPEISLWMSPDPILDKYLPKLDEKDNSKLPGMGGVFNSLNLGLFTYTHQNPVKLIDPDGKVTLSLTGFKTYSAGRTKTKEAGFVVGLSFKSGFQFGIIETEIKSGIDVDYSAFFGLKAEITSASNINNLSGTGYEVGATGGVVGPTAGTSVGVGGDLSNDTSYASWSVSAGGSASLSPVSASGVVTETEINELGPPSGEDVKNFFKYNFFNE